MPRNSEEYWIKLGAIMRAGSIFSLRETTMDLFHLLGFNAAYFLSPVTFDPRVGRIMNNMGFDAEWERHYREAWYLDDPLPQIALSRQATFRWPENVRRERLTEAQLAYLDRLPEFGMDTGFAIPCFGPHARCGFAAVGMPDEGVELSEELRIQAGVCARASFNRYVRIEQPFMGTMPELSELELAVLHLLADGTGVEDIAAKLDMSAHDAKAIVNRLFADFGVTSLSGAAIRGLAYHLIVVGQFPLQSR